jgi:hypothetical protein
MLYGIQKFRWIPVLKDAIAWMKEEMMEAIPSVVLVLPEGYLDGENLEENE